MLWKKYVDILHHRAASRYSETHKGNPSELDIVCTSQSTLQTYLIDWKERRQDLSWEKVGIQLCLSNLPPPMKAALTAADMQYKKTLLFRQVEIECQIGELNEKIKKGEELLEELKKPVYGTTGTKRMVRLQRMDDGQTQFQIQFPWLHLPRIHKLWWGFYENAKAQKIDCKLRNQR